MQWKTNTSEVRNEPGIISGSKVVIEEGSRPKRVVMRVEVTPLSNQFIVQVEYLDASIVVEQTSSPSMPVRHVPVLVFTHSSYGDSSSFEFDGNSQLNKSKKMAAEKALRAFKELVRKM